MPGLAAAEQDAVSLVRRVARALNRRISDLVALLFRHKRARPPASPPPSARPSNPNPCCLTWQSAGIRTSLPPRSLSKSSSSRTRNYSLHVSKDQDSVCYSTVTIIVVTSALALLLQCGGAVRRPLQYQPGSRRT